jgi:hypothetical protein
LTDCPCSTGYCFVSRNSTERTAEGRCQNIYYLFISRFHGVSLFILNLLLGLFFRHCPESTCPTHTSYIPSTKSHVHFLSLMLFIQRIRLGPRLLASFRNRLIFYCEEFSAPRSAPKLEDHPLSVVRDCLFNIFWRPSPSSAT